MSDSSSCPSAPTIFMLLQMKRARSSDETFNPVYPYDTEIAPTSVPFPTPPFVSPAGMQENPPGVLSLRLAEPLTTSNGALTLKMGGGLTLDEEGKLTSQNITSVDPPLKKTKNNISLQTASPLAVSSGALTLFATPPLAVNDNNLTVQSQAPLTLENSKLSLATKGPLTVSEGKLALETEAPLHASDSSSLGLSVTAPLSISSDSLGLDLQAPIISENGKLGLRVTGPLTVASSIDALTVATGSGIGLDSNTRLQAKLVAPLGFDTNGNIKLSTSGGMRLNNGTLILDVNYPFEAQGQLSLRVGSGPLYVDSNTHNLTARCLRGLYITSSNNQTGLEANIKLTKGLMFDGNAIAVNVSKGLEYSTTETAQGVNPIQTKIGLGMEYDTDGAIKPRLGSGLSFDNSGAIVVGNKYDDTLTLWTTPDPSPNCQINSEKDAKLTLVLTKCGSQIVGTVSALALKGSLAPINGTVSSVSIFLRFNENGVLMSNSSLESQYWNYRNGNSTNATPYTNALGFMPNLAAYPKGQATTAKSSIISQVYMNGDTSKPMTFTITFNGLSESEESQVSTYSMTFSWRWTNGDYVGHYFITNSFTFSYIAQE
nr:fiber [Human mastadenovirus C]